MTLKDTDGCRRRPSRVRCLRCGGIRPLGASFALTGAIEFAIVEGRRRTVAEGWCGDCLAGRDDSQKDLAEVEEHTDDAAR